MKKRIVVLFGLALLLFGALCGCGKDKPAKPEEKEKDTVEEWAYSHNKENAVMLFYKDGSAAFDGIKYKSYEVGDKTICFTSEGGTVTNIRYFDETTKDGELRRTVYRITDYKLVPSALTGDSPVIGYWKVPDRDWSYQFTAKGTFLEDEVLPGHYYVNDDGTIRLSYEGNLPATVFYYTIHDDVMTIEYPWVMVKMP